MQYNFMCTRTISVCFSSAFAHIATGHDAHPNVFPHQRIPFNRYMPYKVCSDRKNPYIEIRCFHPPTESFCAFILVRPCYLFIMTLPGGTVMLFFISRFIKNICTQKKSFRNPLTRQAVEAHMKGTCGHNCPICNVIRTNPFTAPFD